MFKKKKKEESPSQTPAPMPEEAKSAKKFPPLPISDCTAAGLIAVVFAAVGVLLCVKTCKAANPKEKKPKKPKRKETARSAASAR